MAKEPIVDLAQIDFDQTVADIEAIRKINAQRFEMEHLTAIVYEDAEGMRCVGYKDVADDEFWVRGHMPGMPLMPGVIMLEAAAQLCSYYATKHQVLGPQMLGFGGLEEVRFRDPVLPGERLVLMCQLLRVRKGRMLVSSFQGFVNGSMVVDGILKGIPIPTDRLAPPGG